jgi:acetyl-CoA synthetase
MCPTDTFLRARDFLLTHRDDYEAAIAGFTWPRLETFNWALDYFDPMARHNPAPALIVVDEGGREEVLSFAELSERSCRVANFLRRHGVQRGDRLLLMLGNVVPLWETLLAAMKLGVIVVPATTLLTPDDLADRLARGGIRHWVTDAGGARKMSGLETDGARVVTDDRLNGWLYYPDALAEASLFVPDGPTRADDPFLLYFTSGTTAKPKLVLHTHQSYPVGHLSTMYWIGMRPGDRHWNISSPGWAKHAWSNVFAPWNAGATVFVYNYTRFQAGQVLQAIVTHAVTTLCAPPTVWRMLILEDLTRYRTRLHEVVSAGEPLNPEVIEQVQAAWGLPLREGYGQTETTATIATTPGQPVKPGSMGRPLPGYRLALLDPEGHEAREGELSLRLSPAPLGLMTGYYGDPERTAEARSGAFYRTGDVAYQDDTGYFWYVGRADDVFKSSDYRISPFELESVLIEHDAVAEAAVVPYPDPVRLAVPKAYVVLRPGLDPSPELALELFRFTRERLAPYKRIRRLEFADLPKTISGKIRRVELRGQEHAREASRQQGEHEYREDQFPELKESARPS